MRPSTISRFLFRTPPCQLKRCQGSSKSGCVMHEIRDFSAPDFVLAGRQLTFGQEPPTSAAQQLPFVVRIVLNASKVLSASRSDDDIPVILTFI